ncbi:hypothetical protein RJ639_024268 [Escallonia herrerae]|uniref:Reverse transcriptase/retrotransposon-derived protein RNase H-like domain-containing protein n=1 Tax=Escallonia herrerae TaxID=1293975 RepID=A0AA89AE02_9ASTE|nr:hypothetical protein RJ639_024268 [Escallonia herrerae]
MLEAVAPTIFTNQTHLDPSDLRLRLTSRSSYGRSHKSKTDPCYQPEQETEKHVAKSESYLRRERSIEDSTNSPPVVSDAIMCRAFPTTLRKAAHVWFKSLRLRSIHSFAQLSDLFQKHFVSSRTRRKNSASLLNVVQERNESLSRYLGRFNAVTLEIDNLDESVKYTAFMCGLRPTTKFAFAILHEIKDKEILERPEKMRSAPSQRERNLWCHYHNDHGHTTDKCESLKRAIEALIKRGHLRGYVNRRNEKREATPLAGRKEVRENAGVINTISGGIAAGGSSGQGRKAYVREVLTTVGPLTKKQKKEPAPTISFSDDDVGDTRTPHDDPLVVTLRVGNFDVKRILVDNGSSAEVLFYEAFQRMNIPSDRLRKIDMPLYGFSNHPVVCEGIIALPVTVGAPPNQAKLMLDFVVVRVPLAYNAILGRTALNQLRAVVSTYHMKMKFPMENGVGEVKGDQVVAWQCYMASCRNRANETLMIEDLRDETKVERGSGTYRKSSCFRKVHVQIREKCLPFFKAIRKAKDFEWTEECQKSFEELKRYLSSPPLLTKPVTSEDLFLYLSISEVAVSTVLIREEEGKQRPVYYISKVLQDVETRYPRIDKVALALVTSARKLRPYFQSHTIVVLTDQPLGKVLQNPDASGRLVNWSVELGEFDIKYQPRTAIKAQALSDFVVECTIPEDPQQLILSEVLNPWLLYVDGSSKEVHEGFSISLRFTSVAHPQSNGQTENMNRSILQGLKRKLDDAKGAWVDELPKVLWAYRTTPYSVTCETPFLLCFGTEALLPVEVGLPTVRVLQFSEAENEENLRRNLDLVGDLVLRKLEVSDPKAAVGKLSPNWEEPYKISKVLRPGAYSLETLSGEAIPRTWNADNLRKYYQ